MTHLHAVPEPAVMTLAQARELRAALVPLEPATEAAIADVRLIRVNAAQIGTLEAAAAELRSQGFLLYPSILDGIARRYHESGSAGAVTPSAANAPPVVDAGVAGPDCTCGGNATCIACVIAEFEDAS